MDTGESIAARTVAVLDRNLVIAWLSRYVRVLDPGIFERPVRRRCLDDPVRSAPHIHFDVLGRSNRLVTQMYSVGESLNGTPGRCDRASAFQQER